jgi:Glycosyl transferases group 1
MPPDRPKVLFVFGSTWSDARRWLPLEEHDLFLANLSFHQHGSRGPLADRLDRERLQRVIELLRSGRFAAVVIDPRSGVRLRGLALAGRLPRTPILCETLQGDFTELDEMGALVREATGQDALGDLFASPDVHWLCYTREFLARYKSRGVAEERRLYFPACTFVHTLLNPTVADLLREPCRVEHPVLDAVSGCLLAAGVFNRDYATFVEACAGLPEPAHIVTSLVELARTIGPESMARFLAAAERAPNVTLHDTVPLPVFIECLRRASAVVVPLLRDDVTTGHLTISNAQFLARPVIAANFAACRDFIEPGHSGLLYEPGDAASLRGAILALRERAGLAAALGRAGNAAEVERAARTRAGFLLALRRTIAAGAAAGASA